MKALEQAAHLVLLCSACMGLAGAARAQSASFAPSYLEARQRAAERTAGQLEQTLRLMSDVTAARVHIGQPDPSHALIDKPLPAARVSAWLKLAGPGPDDTSVRALLASAVPDASYSSIHITRQRGKPETVPVTRLQNVGPFRVTAVSAPWLRALLAVMLATNVVLCSLLLTRWRRSDS